MTVKCVWEHNRDDSLLYAADFPGAYSRGESLKSAAEKMPREVCSYLRWAGAAAPKEIRLEIVQEEPCTLDVRDADSAVLFESERAPLSNEEYTALKKLALKSAEDFLTLYRAVPDKNKSGDAPRKTFYGQVPRSAEEMYRHTLSVNNYYFAEIGVKADNLGDILQCRRRGFEVLEKQEDYLANPVYEGSWDELWSLRKLLRRFIWHDRIHARAMYRMAIRQFGKDSVPNIFSF